MRQRGLDADAVLSQLADRQAAEPDVHGGRLFGLVYPSSRGDVEDLIAEVNRRYLFGNALNPFRFPELAALEREVVGAVGSLLHRPEGPRPAGTMTSGGSESILLSMLVHRQRARARGIDRPEIVAASSAHPAYAKAAHYLGMELVPIPLDARWRADVDAARVAVDPRTAVVVASAFCYPYGVMDPVEELAALAAEAGAGCHVDACIGAFVLPFLERLGRPVPRSTSGFRGSRPYRPTCTSTATYPRAPRWSCTATRTGSAIRCSSTTGGGRAATARAWWPAPGRRRPWPRPGP